MTDADLACRAFVLFIGPFAGDYVATLAAAWPRLPRPVFGRSECARCGAPIPAAVQAPIVSWLMLRGRRPCCGGRIPIVYPIGEAAGLASGIAAAFAPAAWTAIWILALGLTLSYVALVDLRRFRIPGWGLVALAAEAAVVLIAAPGERLERLATGAVLALVLEALRRLIRGRGRGGLGEGDVLLAGVLGILVNWRLAAVMVSLATFAPLALQYARRKSGPTPLGFWLNVSTAFVLLWTEFNLAAQ
jgi:prepilin signal peptidase PulO-like enzyme (type II secretory pathway)